jgi:hypothetical protein
MLLSMQEFTTRFAAANTPYYVELLKSQVGWARYVVCQPAPISNDVFVTWRPENVVGRLTKLKWVSNCVFFEHDIDALLFLLSFTERHEPDAV